MITIMSHTDNATLKFHIDKSQSEQTSVIALLFDLTLSLCVFWGFGGLLCTAFGININTPIVLICALISSAFQLLMPKKLKNFGMIIPSAALLALIAFSWTHIANGFALTANNILNTIGRRFSRIMPQLKTVLNDEKTAQTLFFIAFTIAFSYAVVYCIKNSDIILPIMLSVVGITVCVVFNIAPPLPFIYSAAFYVLGILLKRLTLNNVVSSIIWSVCVVLCILFSGVFYVTELKSSYPETAFDQIRNSICSVTDTLRYGQSSVMPEGDFRNLDPYKPVGEPQLEVVMSNPDSVYLRGFVGENYNSSGWEKSDPTLLYENSDLFYWLHKTNFYGQTQLANASMSVNNTDAVNKITVNNKGASRKYIFSPYELLSADETLLNPNAIGDVNLCSTGMKGSSVYSFESLTNQVKNYPSIVSKIKNRSASLTKEYLNNENHYRKFVYSSYLSLPDKTKNLLTNQLGEYSAPENGHLDYSKAQHNILTYLSSKVSYNPNVSFNGKGDFLQNFLEQSCEGYSVHYATAAALMFRYYGIPARYVEGYLITPQDAENALANSPINIDDTHFHAWVEFYRDGIGWIPFEVTPPYLDIMEKAEEISPVSDDMNTEKNKSNVSSDNNDNVKEGQIESDEIQENHKLKYIITILISIITVIITAFVSMCIFKRVKLCRKLRSLKSLDNKNSVIHTFSYVIGLLITTGYMDNENQLYLSYKSLYNKIGDLSKNLIQAFEIYQKAKFSLHNITDSERKIVSDVLLQTVEKIKSDKPLLKILYDKYVKCIYK